MRFPVILAFVMLSLAGCAPNAPLADEQPTFRDFRPDPLPAHRQADNTIDPGSVPLPYSPPSRGVVLRAPPPPPGVSTAPPAPGQPNAAFSQPFTPGPITGYGQGGMQHEPGMPANPPWN